MKPFKPKRRRYRRKTSLLKKLITGFMIISLSYLVITTFTACDNNNQPIEQKETE